MFEKEIEVEARRGVLLHRRDGTPYWKLLLTCSMPGCDKDVDMGECLCFETEEAMVKCRDNHQMTCSWDCFFESRTPEEREKLIAEAKEYEEGMIAAEGEGLNCDTDKELVMAYMDWLSYFYDGSDFYDKYEIEECPI